MRKIYHFYPVHRENLYVKKVYEEESILNKHDCAVSTPSPKILDQTLLQLIL